MSEPLTEEEELMLKQIADLKAEIKDLEKDNEKWVKDFEETQEYWQTEYKKIKAENEKLKKESPKDLNELWHLQENKCRTKIEKAIDEKKKNIIKHRSRCMGWVTKEPCPDCRIMSITTMEELKKELLHSEKDENLRANVVAKVSISEAPSIRPSEKCKRSKKEVD